MIALYNAQRILYNFFPQSISGVFFFCYFSSNFFSLSQQSRIFFCVCSLWLYFFVGRIQSERKNCIFHSRAHAHTLLHHIEWTSETQNLNVEMHSFGERGTIYVSFCGFGFNEYEWVALAIVATMAHGHGVMQQQQLYPSLCVRVCVRFISLNFIRLHSPSNELGVM